MAKLEDRLTAVGYYDMVARVKEMDRAAAAARAALMFVVGHGAELLRERVIELEADAERAEKAVADLYDSTVKMVDSRNTVEFDLLELREQARIAADEVAKTDPEKARDMLLAIGIDPDE